MHCASDSQHRNLLHEISCFASYRLTQPTAYHPSTAQRAAQTLLIFHNFPSLQSHPLNIYTTRILYMIIIPLFSFALRRSQDGFDAHVANSPMGTRSPFLRAKRPLNELRQLPPLTFGATNVWRCEPSSTTLYVRFNKYREKVHLICYSFQYLYFRVGVGANSFPNRTLDQETIIFGFKWRKNRRVFLLITNFLPPLLLQR